MRQSSEHEFLIKGPRRERRKRNTMRVVGARIRELARLPLKSKTTPGTLLKSRNP